jgi:hypothetical protein
MTGFAAHSFFFVERRGKHLLTLPVRGGMTLQTAVLFDWLPDILVFFSLVGQKFRPVSPQPPVSMGMSPPKPLNILISDFLSQVALRTDSGPDILIAVLEISGSNKGYEYWDKKKEQ